MSNDYFKFYLKEAKKHLKNKEYDNAIECLNRIKIVNPQSFSEKVKYKKVLRLLGDAYYEKKEFDQAIIYYEKVLNEYKNFKINIITMNVNYKLGLINKEIKNNEISKKYFKESQSIKLNIIKIFSFLLFIYFLILTPYFLPSFILDCTAQYYAKHKDYLKAENCYKAIIFYEHKIHKYRANIDAGYYENFGELYIKERKYNLAKLQYEEALHLYEVKFYEIDDNNALYLNDKIRCLFRLGDIYLMNKDNKIAKKYYSQAVILIEKFFQSPFLKHKNLIGNGSIYIKCLLNLQNFYKEVGYKTEEQEITKKILELKTKVK